MKYCNIARKNPVTFPLRIRRAKGNREDGEGFKGRRGESKLWRGNQRGCGECDRKGRQAGERCVKIRKGQHPESIEHQSLLWIAGDLQR